MQCSLKEHEAQNNVEKGFTITLSSTRNRLKIHLGLSKKMIDYSKCTCKWVQSGQKYLRAFLQGI